MWHPVKLSLSELKESIKRRVVVDKKPLLLIYHRENVYALTDKCPHLGASLENGSFSEGILTCARHGAQIDVTTGDILEKAKILFLKMPTNHARTYKTKIEKGNIFVYI